MTFKKEFLRKLLKKLNNSDLYPMTKQNVNLLLTSKRLQDTDKNIIFSSLVNDISKNQDPFLLAVFWNDNINEQNLQFRF